MALTAQQKIDLRARWCSEISRRRDQLPLSRPNLDAAITAVDNWVEANAASYNSALPAQARNNLTAAQKTELLYLVALARYGG